MTKGTRVELVLCPKHQVIFAEGDIITKLRRDLYILIPIPRKCCKVLLNIFFCETQYNTQTLVVYTCIILAHSTNTRTSEKLPCYNKETIKW